MDDIFDLVQAYRNETQLDRRLELADKLARALAWELRPLLLARVRPAQMDDIMQETLKAIFTHFFKFRGKTKKEFFGWCKLIARNKYVDWLRAQKLDVMQYFPAEELCRVMDQSPDGRSSLSPSEHLELKESVGFLAKLKLDCRQLLWDRFVLRMKHSEIAVCWESTADAIRVRISRCRKSARELLT